MEKLDNRLKGLKEEFEFSIQTSFTEQNKQAVRDKIQKAEPRLQRNLLPKALSVFSFVAACLFIFFIFSNGQFQFSGTSGSENSDSEMDDTAMNDADEDVAYPEDPDITGYILAVDEDTILVVSDKPTDYSANGGVDEFYNAIYFSSVPENVEVGEYVRVWSKNGIAESYPGQGDVGRLEKVVVEEREGAQLTEAEVIRLAIKYGKEVPYLTENSVVAIRSIDFNQVTGVWMIEFFDTFDSNIFHIEVEDQQISSNSETLLNNNVSYTTFNHDTIDAGDIVGDFEVTDVHKDNGSTFITFVLDEKNPSGYTSSFPLNGDIIRSDEWLFRVDERMAGMEHFPIEMSDVGKSVQFKLMDEETVQAMYTHFNDEEILEGYVVDIAKVEYMFSETNSTITLYVDLRGSDIQSYETTIELNDQLNAIYENYNQSHNDQLLSGLEPFDVFRLYMHATANEDHQTAYALYIKDDDWHLPSEEEYFNDINSDKQSSERSSNLYKDLQTVNKYIQMKDEDQEEAIILFTLEHDLSFSLIKDKAKDIWKVPFLPMQ